MEVRILSMAKRSSILWIGIIVMAIAFSGVISSADTAMTLKSETGVKLTEVIKGGIGFEGDAKSLDESQVWPAFLFLRLKDDGVSIDGHVEWTSLEHVNYIEGKIVETGSFVEVQFTASEILVKGQAAVGCEYRLTASLRDGNVSLNGIWTFGEQRGPCDLVSNPVLAGKQSEMLGGKSVDEMLAESRKSARDNKPEVFYEDDVVDWKITGLRYPDGVHMAKLTCKWAREPLHKGPSLGEVFFMVSNDNDSPVMAFRNRDPKWKQVIREVTELQVYVSRGNEFTIPVNPNPVSGWVISTRPAGRLVRAMINEHYSEDIEISVNTSQKVVPAYISMSDIETAWEAAKYILKGQIPPPSHELMEMLDSKR